MPLALRTRPLLRKGRDNIWFTERLVAIAGTPLAYRIASRADKLTNVAWPTALTWTETNVTTARLVARGSGVLTTYNGTTDIGTTTDAALPAAAADRSMAAFVIPTAVNVADNPIFGYGTAAPTAGIMWELNNTKQRVSVHTSNSDPVTTAQVAGKPVMLGWSLNGTTRVFSFFNNGNADGVSAALAAIATADIGVGGAVIGDAPQAATWALGNKGNPTIGFVALWSGQQSAAVQVQIARLAAEFYGVPLT